VTRRPGVRAPVSQLGLARAVAAALLTARAPSPASVALILSSDRELAELNERHMGEEGPTDVLSFPMLEMRRGRAVDGASVVGPPGRRLHLGDIVVSVERAAEQALAGQGGQTGDVSWSAADELRLLVVHGALHITGWDHADPRDETEMRALERRILGELRR
jgi:probable rRNA maturation factor